MDKPATAQMVAKFEILEAQRAAKEAALKTAEAEVLEARDLATEARIHMVTARLAQRGVKVGGVVMVDLGASSKYAGTLVGFMGLEPNHVFKYKSGVTPILMKVNKRGLISQRRINSLGIGYKNLQPVT